MVKFKIDGTKYTCPQRWDEVTLRQFQELKHWDGKDFIKLLSIVTGIDYYTLFNTKNFDVDDYLLPYLEFLKKPFDEKSTASIKEIKIDDKYYPVPTDLKAYSFGQKIAACQAIEEAQKEGDVYDSLGMVVAIYMQPIVTGKEYSQEAAKEFCLNVVNNCSITQSYRVGNFFLNSFLKSLRAKTLPWPLNTIKNKKLLAYLNSQYTKTRTRSMRLPMEMS